MLEAMHAEMVLQAMMNLMRTKNLELKSALLEAYSVLFQMEVHLSGQRLP